MSVQENKILVQRVFDEAFNQGRVGIIDEITGDGAAGGLDHQHPDEVSFRDHLKDVVFALREAFPDLHFTVSEMIGEGDWVALHSFMTGINTGSLRYPILPAAMPGPIPPTGRSVRFAHMHLIHFEYGRNKELWHIMDTMTLVQQLGLLKPPVPAQQAA